VTRLGGIRINAVLTVCNNQKFSIIIFKNITNIPKAMP
jgi:hypothetical protein